ncbi:hypothetical protein ACPRNU_12555 [Chromobacterium vaccinii]|uniref:hypothetical protein n=1 Tax=Chromobacterium vaccinii TaxID=1108595 RepID=UPI003C74E54B
MVLSKQERERHYFNLFCCDYPLVPDGDVIPGDKPDFTINSNNYVLGIEMANLYLADGKCPKSMQQQIKLRTNVVQQAQQLYDSLQKPKVELTISFSFDPDRPGYFIQKGQVRKLAQDLSKVAQSLLGQPVGEVSRCFYSHITELDFIYFNPTECLDPTWRVVSVNSPPLLSVDRIRSEVERKDEKIKEYASCNAYWLLLVVDFIDPAQDQEIDWPTNASPLITKYERVIVYKPSSREYRELPIQT